MKSEKIQVAAACAFIIAALGLCSCTHMHVESGASVRHIEIGKSVQGRPIRCEIYGGAGQH
jgi:hypothetical protein